MTIFTPFSKQVQDELRYRKKFSNVQQPNIPQLRVTSLIKGTLRNFSSERLRGLSLGPADTTKFNKIENQINTSGNDCFIGTTYTESGNSAKSVTIQTNKVNLPPPGIENVSIDVQKGGFIFKATINIKCYGKEQYDFLYQTFTRPGTPILIEYGHIRNSDDGSTNLSSLIDNDTFFVNLTDTKKSFYDEMIRGFRAPINTRTGGAVVGMVTNYDVKLNTNNEYEIQIDLINPLEWFYNIQNENTFISYDSESGITSTAIDFNFGIGKGDDYQPETDTILHIVLKELSNQNKRVITFANLKTAVAVQGNFFAFDSEAVPTDTGRVVDLIKKESSVVYVSLDYFLNELLNNIVNISIEDVTEVYNNLLESNRKLARELSTLDDEVNLDININTVISPDSFCIYWNNLRSINNKVVINNKNLYLDNDDSISYSEYYWRTRLGDYIKKYRIEVDHSDRKIDDAALKFFTIDPVMGPPNSKAEIYPGYPLRPVANRSDSDGEKIRSFKGIYIDYSEIRNSFLESDTLIESVIRILNIVNKATNGVFNLKIKFVDREYVNGEERYELLVYDAGNVIPDTNFDTYTFFENDVSEALSYDLDFNLPSAVASIIVANDFQSKYASGGDLKNKLFIDYGYDPSIEKLIGVSGFVSRGQSSDNNVDLYQYGAEEDLSDLIEREAQSQVGLNNMLGYIELSPPTMLGKITEDGLFNTLPSAARITITLQGISGIKWGQLFRVENILPAPYDKHSLFMVVGYDHQINSEGWYTRITGQLIASNPGV